MAKSGIQYKVNSFLNVLKVNCNLLPADFCRPSRECIEVALLIFPPPPLPPPPASEVGGWCVEADVKCDKSNGPPPPFEAERRFSWSYPPVSEAIPGIGGHGGGIGGGMASEDAP